MAENDTGPAVPPSATQLRMMLLEREMERASSAEAAKGEEERKRAAFAEQFLTGHVTEEEIAMVRRLVMNAVRDGKMEAMVYSFPSDLCADGGRAINNYNTNWPETLRGKAKEFYDRYEQFGRPQGYRLKASIINFPGRMPGDVGFFLNWEPDKI